MRAWSRLASAETRFPGGDLLVGYFRKQHVWGAEVHRLEKFAITGKPQIELAGESDFVLAIAPARRDLALEPRLTELRHAVYEIPEHVGQVLVHHAREMIPGKVRIRTFGRVGNQ